MPSLFLSVNLLSGKKRHFITENAPIFTCPFFLPPPAQTIHHSNQSETNRTDVCHLAGGLGNTPNSAETAKVTARFRTPHPTASKATNRQFYTAWFHHDQLPAYSNMRIIAPRSGDLQEITAAPSGVTPQLVVVVTGWLPAACQRQRQQTHPQSRTAHTHSSFLQFVYREAGRNHTEPIARFHAFHHPVIPRRERKSHACSRNTQLPGTTFRYFQRFPCRLSRRSRLYTIPLPPYTPFQPV